MPADSLGDELDVAMATASTSVPVSSTLDTVPSNNTVISNDTELCSGEMGLDMSSQSVEIINNDESNSLDLDLQVTLPPSDVTSRDLDVTSRDLDSDVEGQFMTARFYIGESPTTESAANTRKVS